jgi:MerR family transcriptional regulator/heat shock protein HspR
MTRRKTESRAEGETPVYLIGIVSRLLGLHPQTLRLYERDGLISPRRSDGNTRLYSEKDVERLRLIRLLTHERGVNLAGVELILDLQDRMEQLHGELRKTVDAILQGLLTGRPAPAPKVEPRSPHITMGSEPAPTKKPRVIKIERE